MKKYKTKEDKNTKTFYCVVCALNYLCNFVTKDLFNYHCDGIAEKLNLKK